MRKLGLILAIMLIGVIGLTSCASSSGAAAPAKKEAVPPPPPGTERLTLENGAYAIFKFELPAGAKWGDYGKITADYLIDEENMNKKIRNGNAVRLMGNYTEDQFELAGSYRNFNMGDGPGSSNGPYIMDNTPRTWDSMGAVPNEWFTLTYDISGTKGHAQFKKENVPAPSDKGPFFFGVGISGMDSGRFGGITQLIRNVTLHHKTNPALNVVSKGSGFDVPTYISFYPVMSKRQTSGE
ncbi:MAG: hypothetical protein FWF68_01470 [Spirochaetes bacterium]|nr:hypothetical protein [Spirochaetota bacterium]